MSSPALVDHKQLELVKSALTPREALYVEMRAQGSVPVVAARAAGFGLEDTDKSPAHEAQRLEQDLRIRTALEYTLRMQSHKAEWTREMIAQGFQDAIAMAATSTELSMAYRELAKLYGLYAPEKKEVTVKREQLEAMDDEQLARVAAIDAEFVELQDDSVPDDGPQEDRDGV